MFGNISGTKIQAVFQQCFAFLCAGQLSLSDNPGPLRKYERWLGHWKPEYDLITRETELVLQVLVQTIAMLPSTSSNSWKRVCKSDLTSDSCTIGSTA